MILIGPVTLFFLLLLAFKPIRRVLLWAFVVVAIFLVACWNGWIGPPAHAQSHPDIPPGMTWIGTPGLAPCSATNLPPCEIHVGVNQPTVILSPGGVRGLDRNVPINCNRLSDCSFPPSASPITPSSQEPEAAAQ